MTADMADRQSTTHGFVAKLRGCHKLATDSGRGIDQSDPRLRPPDPGTGRVAGRTSYLLAETGFERSLSERTRSLSEKQVKADKDLRRSAEERFFVFRGFRTFCLTAKSVS